jgi:hypothetical protein
MSGIKKHLLQILISTKSNMKLCFFIMKGGVQEKFDLKQLGDLESNFWEILLKSFEKKSLMGCDREVSF